MSDYTGDECPAQPIKASVKRIMLKIAAESREPSTQKDMILTLYESGIIDVRETFAVIQTWGLAEA